MVEMSATVSPALAQPGAVLAVAAGAQSGDGAQTQDFSALLAGAALVAQAPAPATDTLAEADVPKPALPDFAATAPVPTGKPGVSGKDAGKILPPGKLPAARALAAAAKPTRRDQDDAGTPGENPTPSAPTTSPDVARILPAAVPAQATTPIDAAPAEPLVEAAKPQPVASRSEAGKMAVRPDVKQADPSVPAKAGQPRREQADATAEPTSGAPQQVRSDRLPAKSRGVASAVDVAVDPAPAALTTTIVAPVTTPVVQVVAAALAIPTIAPITTPPVHIAAAADQGKVGAATGRNNSTKLPTAMRDAIRPAITTIVNASPRVLLMAAALPSAAPSSTAIEATSSPISLPDAPLSAATHGVLASSPTSVPAATPNRVDVASSSLTIAAALLAQPAAIGAETQPTLPAQAAPAVPRGVDLAQLPLADAPLAATLPTIPAAPAAAAVQAAAVQSVSLRADAANLAPSATLPIEGPVAHKTTHATQVTTEAPFAFARPDAPVAGMPTDLRSAPVTTPATTAAPTATTPTQDIAALVDRITEARAAAAPHTIRAALVHEDFGSVSLNFRSEASHIHVTLGSADPGFAPAVQAAAAASLAGQSAGDDGSAPRDAPVPQPSPQQQDAATRNDASPQQHAARDRAQGAERQSARETAGRQARNTTDETATASTPQRRGGIYA